jgi:hypothetical protein
MKLKLYNILIDKTKIGTTELEKADAPMGLVFGKINFVDIKSGYDFFKNYCSQNGIEFTNYPEDKLILTRYIPNLRVFDENGNEIIGMGCLITGMDSDIFEISIEGIPYPFYEEEFPKHVKAYNEMFK